MMSHPATMRVAHFTFEYPPSTTGGLGTYLQALVEYQRRAGDQVDVFFLGEEDPPDGTLLLPFHKNGELASYTMEHIDRLSGQARYDLVVCQDWAGVLAARPLWKRSIPMITTCHLPLAWDIGYYDDLPCAFADKMEFMAMMQADGIIAVSESVKEALETMYSFTRGAIRVVHNGTDVSLFSPGQKPEEPVVLYVGRFFEQKGFDLLPGLFALLSRRHPNLRFEIIGIGPLRDQVLAQLEEHALMDRVTVYEFSSQQTVLSLYQKASVVVMPSRHEPFGLVAIESMATATPVVASGIDGLKEIITHGEDGYLVTPEDIAGFADAITRLIDDRQLALDMGARARHRVMQRFAQEICFANTRNVYLDTIRAHGQARRGHA